MTITLSFKSPDAVYYALEDQFGREIKYPKTDEEEKLMDERLEAEEACNKFIEYGEYVKIEIDTDTGTAKVLPVR